jgi:hypothetical protein
MSMKGRALITMGTREPDMTYLTPMAGFKIEKVEKAYLDVFLSIEAKKSPDTVLGSCREAERRTEPKGDEPR